MMANRATVLNAEHLVFSRAASPGVAALVEKYRDYHQQLRHVTVATPDSATFTYGAIHQGKKTAGSSAT